MIAPQNITRFRICGFVIPLALASLLPAGHSSAATVEPNNSPATSQTTGGYAAAAPQSVIILTRDLTDPRIELTKEALGFWQTTFGELELGTIFDSVSIVEIESGARALESYARLLSQQAGRPTGPAVGNVNAPRRDPPTPDALIELDADLVILLSRQNLMPFAWPIHETDGFLVAVRAPAEGRRLDRRAARNEIAHEVGHVLGLKHQRNRDGILMCMPCRAPDQTKSDSSIPPLTDTDRGRLKRRFTLP